ncbi:hypothetical protein BC830DRAFT_1116955 [Chytriomyces sp. MP71]|nr:hypothetical protein BC830DRAFT_1116955 [Chytriomyces sp. MP71]
MQVPSDSSFKIPQRVASLVLLREVYEKPLPPLPFLQGHSHNSHNLHHTQVFDSNCQFVPIHRRRNSAVSDIFTIIESFNRKASKFETDKEEVISLMSIETLELRHLNDQDFLDGGEVGRFVTQRRSRGFRILKTYDTRHEGCDTNLSLRKAEGGCGTSMKPKDQKHHERLKDAFKKVMKPFKLSSSYTILLK